MYCSRCGNKVDESMKFCPKCGTMLGKTLSENVPRFVKQQEKNEEKRGSKIAVISTVISVVVIALLLVVGGLEISRKISQEPYLALVMNEDGNFGYINEQGKEVVKCQYDQAEDFSEIGLAAVAKVSGENADGNPTYRWGYINAKGEEVIEFQYIVAKMFNSRGLATVQNQYGSWGVINQNGEEVLECQYEEPVYFEFYDVAVVHEDGENILINTKGEIIKNLGRDYCYVADQFGINGLAPVCKWQGEGKEYGKYWGYIDIRGEEVIECQYDRTYLSYQENMEVIIEDGKKGFIDTKGQKLTECEYDYYADDYYISDYTPRLMKNSMGNGFAIVSRWEEDGVGFKAYYGFVNEEGKEIIECQYAPAYSFSENGLAEVGKEIEEDGTYKVVYGFVNEEGEEVIACQYDAASDFGENGLALVGKYTGDTDYQMPDYRFYGSYKCKYINSKGRTVLELPEQYIGASKFIKIK